MRMLTKNERYYQDRLQRYFDRNYGPYKETAEFYVNPAVNKWWVFMDSMLYMVLGCLKVVVLCTVGNYMCCVINLRDSGKISMSCLYNEREV